MLTQDELKELVNYDPLTGIFTWNKDRGGHCKPGRVAGSIHPSGYKFMRLHGKSYAQHRLAWLWMEGYFPEHEVDHKDMNPSNNKWNNLRHVTRSCNMRNILAPDNNTTGVVGVSPHSTPGFWQANCKHNGKFLHLGAFKSIDDAVMARWKGEVKYNYPHCQTTSTAYLYLKDKALI